MVEDRALTTYVCANCWGLFICLEGWTGQEKSLEWPSPGTFGLLSVCHSASFLPDFNPRPIPTQVQGPGQLFSGSRWTSKLQQHGFDLSRADHLGVPLSCCRKDLWKYRQLSTENKGLRPGHCLPLWLTNRWLLGPRICNLRPFTRILVKVFRPAHEVRRFPVDRGGN